MKALLLSCFSLCLLTTACQDEEAGGVVSYQHQANAVCPPPMQISGALAAEFQAYADNPLMMQFYKYYLNQQRELAAFAAHDPRTPHCPSSFWAPDNVAAEFAKLPQGAPLREFFKAYAVQQRALDTYYTPGLK